MKYITFFSFFTFGLSLLFVAQQTHPAQLSEEERAMFDLISSLDESELKELGRSIESEISKMSPEEQSKFWDEVDAEAERLAPKIESYVKVQEEEALPPTKEKPIEPKKTKPKPIKKPKEKPADLEKKREVSNKLVEAVQYITSIIHSINIFLDAAQAILEFDDELKEWAEEGKLQHWKSGLSWNFFKDQIDTLEQKLNLLIVQDQENNYKHVEALLQDKPLYNNLAQLERNLKKYRSPLTDIIIDVDTLSLEAEQALQGITSTLFEALNILHVTGAIDSVIAKYKPTAEQLKKEEEERQEQARKEESIKPVRKPITSAGIAEEPAGFVAIPSYPTTSSSRPSIPTSPSRARKLSQTPPPSIKTTPTGPETASGVKAPTKEKKPDEKKKTISSPKKELTDKIADDYIKDVVRGLDASIVGIEDGKLDSIKNHALGRSPYNQATAEVYLPEAARQVRRASDAARSLDLRIKKHFKGSLKVTYKKRLKDEVSLHKKTLEKVANQIRSLRTNEANIPDDKAYAYLGGLRRERVPEVAQRIPSPSSLYTLEDRIRSLLAVVK